MGFVVLKNAASRVQGAVDVVRGAQVRHVHRSDDVRTKGFLLVAFAPVHIRDARDSRSVDDMSGIVPVEERTS